MTFETIIYEEDGPIGTITLNRPDDGNMFTVAMCHEIRDCINEIRRETRTRVIVITGAGDRFFCIGGRKEGMEKTTLYAGVLPTLEMYEGIDRLQKPVIASVNATASERLLESGQSNRMMLPAGKPPRFAAAMTASWIKSLQNDLKRLFGL